MTILNLVPEKLSANGKTNETECRFTQEEFSNIAKHVALSPRMHNFENPDVECHDK